MRFEALKEQLLRGGIAPRRVRRYLAELDDHLAELTQAELAAGYDAENAALRARALLGSDAELARSWLDQPKLRSFAVRAPWAVFILAPPFALLLAFMVPTLALVAISKTFHWIGPYHTVAPTWFHRATAILTLANNLLLPVVIASLLAAIAARQRLSAVWPMIGMIVIALLGMQVHVSFPATGHSQGSIMLGMLLFAGHGPAVFWQTLPAQWLMMMAPAAWITVTWRRLASSKPA